MTFFFKMSMRVSIQQVNVAASFTSFSVHKDELEVRYKLHSSKDVEVLWSRVSNMADGFLHSVSIKRLENTVSLQVTKKKITAP